MEMTLHSVIFGMPLTLVCVSSCKVQGGFVLKNERLSVLSANLLNYMVIASLSQSTEA